MAQKTNFNVNPYYDDFNSEKNFYKVLFNPGRPIQARELTTLQSILQNQVESFGSHIFKEGSVVIPGNIAFDPQFYAVKLSPTNFGIDISLYIKKFIGKKIIGKNSGTTATIQYVVFPDKNEVEDLTIYVKYLDSDNNFVFNPFQDGEPLISTENITYGNTTINAGTTFATLIDSNSTSIGSAAFIGNGVYFIRGSFVNVYEQTLILDYYTNTPSYRVGLKVIEEIVTTKEDKSLFDNAKGFSNYSAPGADRFKISLILTKKLLTDINDTDFVELLRVENGKIKKVQNKTQYSLIKDYLAQRTYDESGDYSVVPFNVSIHNSLNDRLGSNGIFFADEKTEQGLTPSDDLMCVKISPGKAYVRGYDIDKTGTTILDVKKPRDTQSVIDRGVPFEMGNILRINNISGVPKVKQSLSLYDGRKNSNSTPNGTKIGDARVYTFNVSDSAYTNDASDWNLYLYDIQTYTILRLNKSVTSQELPTTSYVKGKSSGATGYAVSAGSLISLRQTSGSFIVGEQITINGIDAPSRTIEAVTVYNTQDIKSVYQPSSTGFPSAFLADTQLDKATANGFTALDTISISGSTVTSAGPLFTSIKPGTIIRYQRSGFSTETYNQVTSVDPKGSSMTVSGVSTVSGICDGDLTNITSTTFSIGIPQVRNSENGSLYSQLPNQNISSVNLGNTNLSLSYQITGESTDSNGVLSFTVSQISGITSCTFQPFNIERYSVHYSDGTTASLTEDKFSLVNNTVTIKGLKPSESNIVVNVSLLKRGTQSKVKTYNRSQTLSVNLSKYPKSGTSSNSSINDGLTYNQYYGLRVQDEEISLNRPDVVKIIAIYESLNTSNPVLDSVKFTSTANVSTNAIIGENIIGKKSKAIARVVSNESTDTLGIVYLNTDRFIVGESVVFEDSNIKTEISLINPGKYKNLTNNYTLNLGQKNQYYDYSKIVRNKGTIEPSKRLLVVFDYYSVPSNDDGDVFTVLSYPEKRFAKDIPAIGLSAPNIVRASDTLDFRPRVSVFSGTSSSPFDFASRTFATNDPKVILSPNETSFVSYDYYTGRIDKLYLDKLGNLIVLEGISGTIPKQPSKIDEVMEIATITLPPYLYNPIDAAISISDNKRYTMRDIGEIENRVENLEKTTSLSLLELNTQTLQIQDAQGFNRFKTGFFVDDFKNSSLINSQYSQIQVDSDVKELKPIISKNSIKTRIVPETDLTDENIDFSVNFNLLDPNVQKTGELITLKYDSVEWIKQPLATKVENVNPFHIIQYNGNINLSPKSDKWVRTIQLETKYISVSNSVRIGVTGTYSVDRIETNTSSNNILISKGKDSYMRSRNTQFSATNVKPLTQFYQFFDGNSSVDFIPKLIEIANDSTLQNYGASAAFVVGETVVGSFGGKNLITFRVASANHKYGQYDSPSTTYNINPYNKNENLSSSYSSSSKILNVDTYSLSEEAQGKYSGYLVKGMKLVGSTSGATAYVKDLRLISDNYGDLIGTFFLRDPNTVPQPPVIIETGTKTYKITNSPTNETPLPGSKLISTAEANYTSEGVVETKQLIQTTTTTTYYYDPLAQSFSVGGTIGEPLSGNGSFDDVNGAFITAIDLFFASKDTENNPVTVEIRTVELGKPTRNRIGNPVTLRPDQINVSNDASIATKITFDYPIYLAPGNEYAIVILSPNSKKYEVWIAEMGEKTVNTKNLPDAESVRYSSQFALGSLYKSQNGSIWTENQYQDLMFKLYKAKFTSNSGKVFFYNPTLDQSNGYIQKLNNNPITTFPRKLKVGIDTITDSGLISDLAVGRKVTGGVTYGYIVGTGSSVASVGLSTGGFGYTNQSNVSTYAITGTGSGLTLTIATANGNISGAPTIVNRGNGYSIGDVVGIVTSSAGGTGKGAQITITNVQGIDTLYLSGVQGGTVGSIGAGLSYYNNSGSIVSLGSTLITSITSQSDEYSGNYLSVEHFDHGMYSKNNKLTLSDVGSSYAPVVLTSPLSPDATTLNVSTASTADFGLFEGVPVGAANTGYIKINNEIIGYESVDVGILSNLKRNQDSTLASSHDNGSLIYKYELNGVSLRRINKTHDISDLNITIDGYHLEINRSTNGTNRSSDGVLMPQLSFINESTTGGSEVRATENIQYDSIIPYYNVMTPGSTTSISAQIRTVSGTSVNGSEVSFQDKGFEPVQLNELNKLSSTRLICSKVNETTYLNSLPNKKSFTTAITLNTEDSNLSPIIFCDISTIELHSNRLNNPIADYPSDSRVNSLHYDPHAAVYVSNTVKLTQTARSLKVILSAYRHSSADFRVLYSLIRPGSSEVESTFELFPGYDNLNTDLNQDGYPDIVTDSAKNNGKSDIFVPASLENQFLEYQFTADNLGDFVGYTIKIVMSGTDQAHPPRIKDLRSIAIR